MQAFTSQATPVNSATLVHYNAVHKHYFLHSWSISQNKAKEFSLQPGGLDHKIIVFFFLEIMYSKNKFIVSTSEALKAINCEHALTCALIISFVGHLLLQPSNIMV